MNKNNHSSNSIIIGTIIFDEVINENEIKSRSGRFNSKGIGECIIEVYPNEGQIPHFHLSNVNRTFNCCIRIYENKYFKHGNYTDILNSKQCRQLNNYLKEICEKDNNKTIWEYIIFVWNDCNPNCKYPEYKKTDIQPHYENMREFNDSI